MPRQLRMVRPDLENLPALEVPAGYAVRTYQDGDDVHWANIINASFGGERTAAHTRREIIDREVFDPEGLFFATFQGTPIGTACTWKRSTDEREVGYLHMVGVGSKHAGHGLGKCVSLCVLHHLKAHGFICAMLDTDDFRLPAVKTYLNLSFSPVYVDTDQPSRWQKVIENLGLPPLPDRSAELRTVLSESIWSKVSR